MRAESADVDIVNEEKVVDSVQLPLREVPIYTCTRKAWDVSSPITDASHRACGVNGELPYRQRDGLLRAIHDSLGSGAACYATLT